MTGHAKAGRRPDVLRFLQDLGRPAGIAEVAAALGVHANTVRFHLEKLLENGQVERTATGIGGPGRPAQMFASLGGMDPTGPRQYRALAEVLVADLAAGPDAGRRARRAGQSWGRGLAADSAMVDPGSSSGVADSLERLVHLLDDLGFAPELRPEGDDGEHLPAIGLRHCPFLELAAETSEVVCPVHLGLMRGALESWGAPVKVDRLDPFVQPDLCLTHLSVR